MGTPAPTPVLLDGVPCLPCTSPLHQGDRLLPLIQFHRRRDTALGRIRRCKVCMAQAERIRLGRCKRTPKVRGDTAHCAHCDQWRPLVLFGRRSSGGGPAPYCRPCRAARRRTGRERHSPYGEAPPRAWPRWASVEPFALAAERCRRGWTQARAGAEFGVSGQTWYRWETGATRIQGRHEAALLGWLEAGLPAHRRPVRAEHVAALVRRLGRDALAARLGVKRLTLFAWERGVARPSETHEAMVRAICAETEREEAA